MFAPKTRSETLQLRDVSLDFDECAVAGIADESAQSPSSGQAIDEWSKTNPLDLPAHQKSDALNVAFRTHRAAF
jgi:hypothetical protein